MLWSTIPILAATVTIGLTPLVQKLGLNQNWVDQPGKRKVHQQPIVRVGGIAIFMGMLCTTLLFLVSNFQGFSHPLLLQMAGILLGGTGFFLIGFLDDIFHLSPFLRLFLQGLVACLSWFLGVRVDALPIPFLGAVPTGILSLPITFFWLAGVANAINWVDGLDGLAGGISAIAALTFSILCWDSPLAMITLALAGSLMGFLRYNVNPARIFMGDGGSYFIGFTLAAIAAVGLMHPSSTFAEASLPFWVLAVPIVDMVRVILSRLWDKKSPFFPDQRHLHHKLLRANFSVKAAVGFAWTLTLWFGTWALWVAAIPYSTFALLFSSGLLMITSFPLWSPLVAAPARSR